MSYGSANTRIGLAEGGGEHWKPMFFAVDAEGSIHLPDFYKARVAVYDRAGKLKGAKPCPAGISPRLNYFGMSPQGNYVAFGDGSLFVIKKDGTLARQHNFAYGIIPARVIPTESTITPLGRYGAA